MHGALILSDGRVGRRHLGYGTPGMTVVRALSEGGITHRGHRAIWRTHRRREELCWKVHKVGLAPKLEKKKICTVSESMGDGALRLQSCLVSSYSPTYLGQVRHQLEGPGDGVTLENVRVKLLVRVRRERGRRHDHNVLFQRGKVRHCHNTWASGVAVSRGEAPAMCFRLSLH